ncbi:7-carboxy-7-deazaguanine synthase [Variovorax beijingensis]|nr:7-carboxy-7-deazaguanine synthase [Variovorax beijingensis]
MTYSIKEIFYTLQGEGANAGRPAVFCRFAGCNLWSGREEDRATAVCKFCDTDFVGTDGTFGGKYRSADQLADRVASLWSAQTGKRFVVLTGGEPMLQVDAELLRELHARDFEIAVETNGTLDVPDAVDWICVSPKAGAPLRQLSGNELKVVVPQDGQNLDALVELSFDLHLLQPMDGPLRRENTQRAIEVCLRDPRWRLSTQTHKTLGIR